jgi:hypothetical protein
MQCHLLYIYTVYRIYVQHVCEVFITYTNMYGFTRHYALALGARYGQCLSRAWSRSAHGGYLTHAAAPVSRWGTWGVGSAVETSRGCVQYKHAGGGPCAVIFIYEVHYMSHHDILSYNI